MINTLNQIIRILFLVVSLDSIAQTVSKDGVYSLVVYNEDSLNNNNNDFLFKKFFCKEKVVFGNYDILIGYLGQSTKIEHYSIKDSIINKYEYSLDYKNDTFLFRDNFPAISLQNNGFDDIIFERGNYSIYRNIEEYNNHSYNKIINVYQNGSIILKIDLRSVSYKNAFLPDFKELKFIKSILIKFD